MSESQIDTIDARLARLERENRRLRRIAAAITAGVVLLILCGAGSREEGVIKGERMLLANNANDSGIAMGTSPDGEPAITFRRTLNGKEYSMEMRMFVA